MSSSGRPLSMLCLGLSLLAIVVVLVERDTTAASAANQPASVLVPAAHHSNGALAAPDPLRPLFSAPQQSEKTIGESQKNIQVLKEFPQGQLIPMMNLMSASLGVRCNFCHVNNNGQWDYASDDKQEKKTAREMITMTLNINKTTFHGNTDASCFTCHRGRTGPVGLITLPLPEPTPRPGGGSPAGQGGPGAAAPGAQTAAPQLTVDDILNKYTTALGGQAAIDKLKTRVMKGTYAMTNGNSLAIEIDQSGPEKIHVMLTAPQAAMERGFNGTAGWEKNPRGVMDLTGSQLADTKSAYALFRDIKLKEQFTRMNARKDKLDGRDVNAIFAASANGKRERLYFDADTGLLLRRVTLTPTPIGVIPEQADYEDYRDVDGVKIPFTVKLSGVDNFSNGVRKFAEIKINAPLADSTFNKPSAPAGTQPNH